MTVPVRADDSFHILFLSALWRILRGICLGSYRPLPIVVKPMGLAAWIPVISTQHDLAQPSFPARPEGETLAWLLDPVAMQLLCPISGGVLANTRWAMLCFDALDGVAQAFRLSFAALHDPPELLRRSLITRAVGNRISEAAPAYHGHGPLRCPAGLAFRLLTGMICSWYDMRL